MRPEVGWRLIALLTSSNDKALYSDHSFPLFLRYLPHATTIGTKQLPYEFMLSRDDIDLISQTMDKLYGSVVLLGVRVESKTSSSLNPFLQESGQSVADTIKAQQSTQAQCSIQ